MSPLADLVVEVDAAGDMGQAIAEQRRRHLQVGEARHERARVDERVERRLPPADRAQHLVRGSGSGRGRGRGMGRVRGRGRVRVRVG